MPKKIDKAELDAIVKLVQSNSQGIKADELRDALCPSTSFRTLQRRLRRLVADGKLVPRERGRATRYLPVQSAVVEADMADASYIPETGIPLSAAAQEIKRQVSLSVIKRTPVGYNRDFLFSYEPNKTAYLTSAQRQELAAIGDVGFGNLPAGTYVRQVMHRLLIDLSWNSSRLEGNTYSLLETERLLDAGENAAGKKAEETQMILNHKEAIEMLASRAEEIGFNRYTICNLHALLSDNLLANPAACGRLRSRAVLISGTVFHPLEIPQQIEAYFQEILQKAEAIKDFFEQAFFVMVQLPYLQPFEDVNKRVSRLAANIPLLKNNYCPLSFTDVPQNDYLNGIIGVYELNRTEYLRDVFIWAYRRSAARYAAVRESLGEPDPFRLRYRSQISECVRDIVRKMIPQQEVLKRVQKYAEANIPDQDRQQFSKAINTELCSLHDGNIARYHLSPAEFKRWHYLQGGQCQTT